MQSAARVCRGTRTLWAGLRPGFLRGRPTIMAAAAASPDVRHRDDLVAVPLGAAEVEAAAVVVVVDLIVGGLRPAAGIAADLDSLAADPPQDLIEVCVGDAEAEMP